MYLKKLLENVLKETPYIKKKKTADKLSCEFNPLRVAYLNLWKKNSKANLLRHFVKNS